MKHKPEWYEIVWTIGINDKEYSKFFPPEQKKEALDFYNMKTTEILKTPGSDVRMYLTHTNRLYDLLYKTIHRTDGCICH